MKKIILILTLVFGFNLANAQVDVIKKQIGETLRGTIISQDENVIVFTYEGQNVPYTIAKNAVEKVTYGSTGQEVRTSNKIEVEGEADWAKVIIIEDLNSTAGLEVGPRIGTPNDLTNYQSGNSNSNKKMKMHAARLGFPFILVTTDASGSRVAHGYKY